ncbi:hypothetical protein [Octadecabacter sp. R77987]|uniref:hypothetical protein n=1 Tax=Octadecabacter sp. R77987 TaxID=3093874 RepID=UPI00366E851B
MKKLLFVLVLLAAVSAYFTRPGPDGIEAQINTMLQSAINDGQLEDLNDPGAVVLLALCKSDVPACAQMLRQGMDVTLSDQKLFTTVRATGFGKSVTCYGAYTRLFCPGGLRDDA